MKKWFILMTAIILTLNMITIRAKGDMDYYKGEPQCVSEKDYCPVVLKAINNAKESIDIAMYLMPLEKKGNRFREMIDALVAAHERGVRVRIVLDKQGETPSEEEKWELEDYRLTDNSSTYDYLKDKELDVRYDIPEQTMHASVVVIDGKTVITGSMYWAEPHERFSSFSETNILIVSEDFARSKIEFIDSIETE